MDFKFASAATLLWCKIIVEESLNHTNKFSPTNYLSRAKVENGNILNPLFVTYPSIRNLSKVENRNILNPLFVTYPSIKIQTYSQFKNNIFGMHGVLFEFRNLNSLLFEPLHIYPRFEKPKCVWGVAVHFKIVNKQLKHLNQFPKIKKSINFHTFLFQKCTFKGTVI